MEVCRERCYSTAYNYDQILPFAAISLGVTASIAIGRHFKRKGEARGAAAKMGS